MRTVRRKRWSENVNRDLVSKRPPAAERNSVLKTDVPFRSAGHKDDKRLSGHLYGLGLTGRTVGGTEQHTASERSFPLWPTSVNYSIRVGNIHMHRGPICQYEFPHFCLLLICFYLSCKQISVVVSEFAFESYSRSVEKVKACRH